MTEPMAGNPHYAEAAKVARYYEQRLVQEDADVIALGVMSATLALAFEQRTANLIACSQKVYIKDSPDEIRHRLGENPLGVEPVA